MATAAKSAETRAVAAERAASDITVSAPSRREFLFYIWGASMALLLGEATAGLIWFAFPRFREGEFGGTFKFGPDAIPEIQAAPFTDPVGRFHITHVENGVLALYQVCTHLGCLPKWVATNHRFECPCHGSKYELSGLYIEGPAPRSLDRFVMTITYVDGTQVTTDAEGDPIALDPAKEILEIEINTGSRIQRAGRV